MEATMTLVDIIDFAPEYRADFARLNAEWMDTYFGKKVDNHLDNPEQTIIRNGGFILFAQSGKEIIGTCAVLKETNKLYEIADMVVANHVRGGRKAHALTSGI